MQLTATIKYQVEDDGYLAKCPELDAVAWGKTLKQASEELIEAVIDVAEVIITESNEKDPRYKFAKLVMSSPQKKKVKALLGI